LAFSGGAISRVEMENRYQKAWQYLFARRLWVGRTVQHLFGDAWLSELALSAFSLYKPALRRVMRLTHGQEI